MGDHPYLRHPEWHADDPTRPIAFAHRGGTDAASENTVAAFDHAWSLGYRYLETDVHVSRDGELVAFHDPDLRRTCGVEARIGDLTARELAEMRVDGAHRIPSMIELLERFPDAHFNIDAKSDAAVELLSSLLVSTDRVDRTCVASFSQRRVDRLRRLLGPDAITNLGSVGVAQLRLAGRTRRRGAQIAQIPVSAGRVRLAQRRFLAAADRAGIAVHVWTINDEATIHELLDLGVGGIMTDETALLRSVWRQRSLWPE